MNPWVWACNDFQGSGPSHPFLCLKNPTPIP